MILAPRHVQTSVRLQRREIRLPDWAEACSARRLRQPCERCRTEWKRSCPTKVGRQARARRYTFLRDFPTRLRVVVISMLTRLESGAVSATGVSTPFGCPPHAASTNTSMATIAPLRIRSRGELNLTPPVFLLIHPPVKAQAASSPQPASCLMPGMLSARSSYNAIARADFRANLVRYRRRAFDLLAGPDQGIGAVRRARQVDLWSHSGDPADHLSKAPITGYPSIVILRLIWLLTAAVTADPPTRPFIDPSIAIRSLLAGRTARNTERGS